MSASDKGITTRAPAVALLCVNSADQDQFSKTSGLLVSTQFPSQIFINNQQPFLFGYMTRLALTEVAIEYDTPNVNPYNNKLTVGVYNNASVLQAVVRITIDEGFYTAPLLGVAVRTALNANATLTAQLGANTFEITYGGNLCGTNPAVANQTRAGNGTNYVINTTSTTGRFAILPSTVPYPGLPAIQDDLTNMMGITPTLGSLASYKSLQGGYASLQYTQVIDIVSNLLTKNQNIRDSTTQKKNINSSILARIYLANEQFTKREVTITYDASGAFIGSTDNAIGTAPGTLRREFYVPKQIQWNNTENVDIIDIQVLDSQGRQLFYKPYVTNIGADTIEINSTADVFLTIQATEN